MPTTRLRFVAFMTSSGHRVRESASLVRDTEFTVTRWVGVGHAQARASRELRGALAGAIVTIPALYMAGDRDLVAFLSWHGSASRESQDLRAGAAEDSDDARLRTLDAAGVVKRSQFCDHRLPAQLAELTSKPRKPIHDAHSSADLRYPRFPRRFRSRSLCRGGPHDSRYRELPDPSDQSSFRSCRVFRGRFADRFDGACKLMGERCPCSADGQPQGNGRERSPGRGSSWRRIHADRELSSRLAYLNGVPATKRGEVAFWHSIDRSDRAGRSFLGHPRFAQAVAKPLSKGQTFWIARYG
jgi:hypothetical protein